MKNFEEAEKKPLDIFKPKKDENNKLEDRLDELYGLDKHVLNFADIISKNARS